MRFHQTGNIREILDPLALSGLGLGPGFDLASERVLQRGHPHENAVHIGRDSTRRKITIEVFCAELNTDRGVSLEVDGPFESLRAESGLLKERDSLLDSVDGNDEIHILGHHRLFGPMVDRDSANDAPGYVRSLQAIDEPHDVVRAAPRLPIVDCFPVMATMIASGGLARQGGDGFADVLGDEPGVILGPMLG